MNYSIIEYNKLQKNVVFYDPPFTKIGSVVKVPGFNLKASPLKPIALYYQNNSDAKLVLFSDPAGLFASNITPDPGVCGLTNINKALSMTTNGYAPIAIDSIVFNVGKNFVFYPLYFLVADIDGTFKQSLLDLNSAFRNSDLRKSNLALKFTQPYKLNAFKTIGIYLDANEVLDLTIIPCAAANRY